MVDFALASQRLQPSSSGGISPTLLTAGSAHVIAPQLNANAANIKNSAMPVPDIIIDSTIAATASAAAQINQAAFNYSQREAQVLATNSTIAYSKFARETLEGHENENGEFVPGYLSSKGLGAGAAYTGMKDSLKNKRDELLSSLNPMARQMAVVRMASSENTAIGAASQHRQTQLGKAQEEARFLERQDKVANIVVNPASIYTKDPITGMNAREDFFKDAVNIEATTKAWYEVVSEVNEKVYLTKGLADATEFYNKVSATELTESPAHLTRVQEDMARWNKQAISDEKSARVAQESKEKKDRKKRYDDTERKITIQQQDGVQPTKQFIKDSLIADNIDPEYARSVNKDAHYEIKWERYNNDYIRKEEQRKNYATLVANKLAGVVDTPVLNIGPRSLVAALQTEPENRNEFQQSLINDATLSNLVYNITNQNVPTNEQLSGLTSNYLMDADIALAMGEGNFKANEDAIKTVQRAVALSLSADINRGKMPSTGTMQFLVERQLLSSQDFDSIRAEVRTENRRVSDLSEVEREEALVRADPSYRGYRSNRDLTDSDRGWLSRISDDVQNPKFQQDYKEVVDNINVWLGRDTMDIRLFDKNVEARVQLAKTEARARIWNKEDKYRVMEDMNKRFNKDVLRLSDLSPLRTRVKPTTMEELADQARLLESRKDTMSPGELYSERAVMWEYQKALGGGSL